MLCYSKGHNLFFIPIIIVSASMLFGCREKTRVESSPRIVNIINFIRLMEPRFNGARTNEILYQTVVSQAEDLRSKGLVGTYLLQYDALKDSSYQKLMKEELARGCEVGAWWEITQPQVEDAGMIWRGRFPWDWQAHVDFSVGYTPDERVRLVDVYMKEFKEIFGFYPRSVGSWFIDAITLGYLYDEYAIEASCMCKDQVGTDGYTLWGGYMNGAFYPSRQNGYMPAQTAEGCIPVPVFRMLGSDPIYQYEAGVGGASQSVESLEPVSSIGGSDPEWVDWYFRMFTDEPHLGYNYVQVGQENSFTWQKMKKGFVYQTALLSRLVDEGKLRIETLGETGRWFRENYPLNPPTSLVVTEDSRNGGRKTLWFNSRFYRANLLWEDGKLRFRDIHLFDENFRSDYLDYPDTLPVFRHETFPIVDGCLWSSSTHLSGLNFVAPSFDGGDPVFSSSSDSCQRVIWPSSSGNGKLIIVFSEDEIRIQSEGNIGSWYFELDTVPEVLLPFINVEPSRIEAAMSGQGYGVTISRGSAVDIRTEAPGKVFRLLPEKGVIDIVIN